MRLIGTFPDAEAAVLAWMTVEVPGVKWRSELPQSWDPAKTGALPAGLVQRVPAGTQAAEYEDAPTIDVHLWTADRESLWALVGRAQLALVALATNNDVDTVTWATRFGVSPYENPDVRHAFASITVVTRAG